MGEPQAFGYQTWNSEPNPIAALCSPSTAEHYLGTVVMAVQFSPGAPLKAPFPLALQ
jgi:hypothetical protein